MSQVDVLETALENVLLEILTIRAERDSAMVPEPLILTSCKFTSQIPTREESMLKGLASRKDCRERMALLALMRSRGHFYRVRRASAAPLPALQGLRALSFEPAVAGLRLQVRSARCAVSDP